jgi:hypothetical protein
MGALECSALEVPTPKYLSYEYKSCSAKARIFLSFY